MMDDEKNAKKGFEGTMVDLGEDLLEATRVLGRPVAPPLQPAVPPPTDAEELQRGEIFMGERLFDDAKKVFRKLLRQDPNNAKAKEYLEEIQKYEIQDLLGGEAPRKRLGETQSVEDDPMVALERLERELHISFDKAELKPVPDLFRTTAEFGSYQEDVVEAVAALSARERLDLGVAHLEMGLFEVAQAVFETVLRNEEYRIVGMYLLGLALIYGGKAIEATIRLEPLARDLTLAEAPKTDFLYLMGLAFEKLSDTRKAREFYRRVYLLNPRYRDVVDKLK